MKNQTESEVASELVRQILNGNSIAESEMVKRYDRGLRFMLKHKSQSMTLAEDIAQETWRIVIEKIRNNDLRDHSKLSAFIVQIGKNQLLMHYRSSQVQRTVDEEDVPESIDESLSPQEILEKHNLALLVKILLSEMKTHRDKDILNRFYIKEECKSSIREHYNLSDLHFNRVLFRARQRFKQLWDESQSTKEAYG